MSLRQQNKARARASILAAAEKLINAQGGRQTTTRQIAEQAGVSYQTLYNYFPSKAHIVRALIEADIQNWMAQVDQIIKHYDGDLLATLSQINRRCFQVMQGESFELWREILMQFPVLEGGAEQELATLNVVAHERYYALLNMAQGMGELQRGVDLHLLAHNLFCLTDYAILRFFLALNADPHADVQTHLHTLDEQLAQLVRPYLVARAM